jgi:hypothetical protein
VRWSGVEWECVCVGEGGGGGGRVSEEQWEKGEGMCAGERLAVI